MTEGGNDAFMNELDEGITQFNIFYHYLDKSRLLETLSQEDEQDALWQEFIAKLSFDDRARYLENCQMLISIGRYDEVLVAYNRFISNFPDEVYGYKHKVYFLRDNFIGRQKEALAVCDEFLARFPDDDDFDWGHNQKAELLKELGHHKEATKLLEEYYKLQRKKNMTEEDKNNAEQILQTYKDYEKYVETNKISQEERRQKRIIRNRYIKYLICFVITIIAITVLNGILT